MLNLNYHVDTGLIHSYNEGPDETSNETPEGCGTLHFAKPLPGMINNHGQLTMKVDILTGKAVWINPTEIPDPLPNPPNAAQ